jgi:transporter family-2 protein
MKRDHFGWLSFDVHPAGWERIAGCSLMVIGLTLIAKF